MGKEHSMITIDGQQMALTRDVVQKNPCESLRILARHGNFDRTGELIINYFGGIAGVLAETQRLANSDCPDLADLINLFEQL